jgi:GGDEF domain-containing protein
MIESEFETSRAIISRVKENFKSNNLNASIGWSQYGPRKDYKLMIKEADEDMYSEKKAHRKTYI